MLDRTLFTRRSWYGGVALLASLMQLLIASPLRADAGAYTAAASGAAPCDAPRQCLDRAVQTYLREGPATAVQIAIWKNGKFVYSKAFGFADPEHEQKVTTRSHFQIGSNAEKATALAVLRAVEDGRLHLDDSVERALPFLTLARDPDWASQATVRDLLTHQSGLWDDTPREDAPEDLALARTVQGRFAARTWTTTAPGEGPLHAASNYSLLGAILEHAYGRSYPDIMEREVYAPLRLTNTFARRGDALSMNRAVWGYGAKEPPWASAPRWVAPGEQADHALLRPAAGSWSTAEDECRIGAFLLEGRPRFLRKKSRQWMTTAETAMTPRDSELGYAFGLTVGRSLAWSPEEHYPVEVWFHLGSTATMSSQFLVLPAQRLVVSILTNVANDAWLAGRALLSTALRHYAKLPPKEPRPRLPASGASYAGSYADPRGLGTIELSWDGQQLQASAPELEARGVSVDPAVVIRRPNVLVLRIEERELEFTVWPSPESEAGLLVSRESQLTRVSPDESVSGRRTLPCGTSLLLKHLRESGGDTSAAPAPKAEE